MQIHTDKITVADLHRELPSGCDLEVAERGSRSRARRFDVGIGAERGTDAHGIKRAYARNSGQYGADTYSRAATWVEWGDWMVALFKIDPEAKIGHYNGAGDFIEQTRRFAPHRPERENAVAHAQRWAEELLGAPVA
jgi:hypothetical protein